MSDQVAKWEPLEGPQTEAYNSPADVLGYGGAGGGGKTDLLLGLAGTQHYNSVIFRRIFPSMRGIIERSREIYNSDNRNHAKDSFNESLHIWRLDGGRIVELSAMQYEKDRETQRGRPRDFYGFDEGTEFSESQFRFVTAWNRSTRVDAEGNPQRCRVVVTFNPPTTAEGQWVVRYFAPWLDSKHPNPAEPGELRWYATIEGEEVEVDGPEPIPNPQPQSDEDKWIYPRSRTFIPARLKDNPILEKTGYRATLQSLPEPLRSQMLYGDFNAGVDADPWQVIPTKWIDAAIERGRALRAQPDFEMPPLSALGADPSRGGRDKFVIAPRHDNVFGELIKHTPGKAGQPAEIDGPTGAKLIEDEHEGTAHINVDVIGIGSSVYDSLKDKEIEVNPINNSEAAVAYDHNNKPQPMRDKTGKYPLVKVRSASYWKFREALDPVTGDDIALPDDAELRADLMAARYKVTTQGIQVGPKTGPGSIHERLGRSPDCADAVVLAYWIIAKPVARPDIEINF